MIEIVLDTETTGMDPNEGDRIVEIGCVEIEDYLPTGRTYHQYINPERDVPAEAVAVHGITNEFLKDKPVMAECIGDFLDFIKDSRLVIHNAEFDMKFLNWELRNLGFPSLPKKNVVDTLAIARQKFPGSPANLDALCRRYSIDNTNRTLHGALLDSELLAEVYLELLGGRQHDLALLEQGDKKAQSTVQRLDTASKLQKAARNFPPTAEELKAHQDMVAELKNPLWAGFKE